MSNHRSHTHRHGDQRAGPSVHCYQSIWMARLTQTSSSATPQGQNGLSLSLMTSAKKFTEVTDVRTIRIMNEGVSITEDLDRQPFPIFDVCQSIGCDIDSKTALDNIPHGQGSRPQFDFKPANNGIRTVRKFSSLLGMAPHGSGSREHVFEKASQFLEEPANQMVQYKSNKGKAPQLSLLGGRDKVKPLTLGSASKEHTSNATMIDTNLGHNHDMRNYSILGHDKNWNNHSTSGKSGTLFSRPYNASFAGEPSRKMQNLPHTELVTFGKDKNSVNLAQEGCTLRRMPGSMLDMETMELLKANSVNGLARGRKTFSPTTHNLLLMEHEHHNKQKRGFEEPSDSKNSDRNMFSQFLSLSPPLGPSHKGVRIQLLDSSSDSQGKQDVREILNPGVCQNNDSSTETATMDMETFKERINLPGVNSMTSNKNICVGPNPPSQATIVSARKKVEHQRARTILPDMNELPVLQVSSSSLDNAEPSSSRTQSLDADHLLFHNETPPNQKARRFPNGLTVIQPITTIDPSSRWLKRFKLSVPHSCGVGTKSSNLEEALSHRKVNKSFSKVIGGSDTFSSGQDFSDNKCDNKDIVANKSAIVLKNVESPQKKDLDILLSHSWITRWCRVSTQKKKVEAVVVCEPQSTKMDFAELQNKQFPSIGAMALMGKALNGFQPCEFRKRGSFVVWNTKVCE